MNEVIPLNQTAIDTTTQHIIKEHAAAQADAKSAVEHAMACGSYLLDMKEMLHAEKQVGWKEWVETNCPFKIDTARRYMKLAEAESTQACVDYLASEPEPSIAGALRALKPPKKKEEKEELNVVHALDHDQLVASIHLFAMSMPDQIHPLMLMMCKEFNIKASVTKKQIQDWKDSVQVKA